MHAANDLGDSGNARFSKWESDPWVLLAVSLILAYALV